jgi:octaprenyl-diphosphate synthase
MTNTLPWLACIADDLMRVEECLQEATRSEVGAVRAISGHTLFAGGKRLRPALAILSARVINRTEPAERCYAAAAAAEMLHMATLIHDDVVDEAPERRGKPTANSLFGNGITVLTGDFLFAKALEMVARDDANMPIIRVFSQIAIGMAEGEVLQAAVARCFELETTTYERVIDLKSARFIAGCCEMGCVTGGGTPTETQALAAYGHHLGMAFQIADDLLDFLGDPKRTGKPLGTDLRDGRVTLPLIHTFQRADTATRDYLTHTLTQKELTDAEIAAVTATIARHGGFAYAQEDAARRSENAIQSLAALPANPYKDALLQLARYVVSRDR